jgi:hypothetical protein
MEENIDLRELTLAPLQVNPAIRRGKGWESIGARAL